MALVGLSRPGKAAVALLAVICALALLPAPSSASLPGENGELLIFGGKEGDKRGFYLLDLDSLSLTKLPIEAHDLDPHTAAWSPTGSHLAFTRYDRTTEEHGLWVHEMASGDTHRLRVAEAGEQYTGVSWSPSGGEITVGTNRRNPEGGGWSALLVRVTAEGALIDEVDLPADFVWRIEWSPARPELLLWLGWIEGGNPWDTRDSVCLFSPATATLDCIVDGLWPGWSPDGEQIALGIDPTSNLAIVDRSGRVVHEFDPSWPGRMTSWSPDGRFIAYPHYLGEAEAGEYAINLIDLDTFERDAYAAGVSGVLDLWWRPQRPASGFVDVSDAYVFAADVTWLATNGYTDGCNPPLRTKFCPARPATRGELAALLHRALGGHLVSAQPAAEFTDIADSVFAADIAWLSATGVTKGCNPPEDDRFCPDDPVTRGQMASFVVRAMGYVDDGGGDLFSDDDDSIFERDIDRLGAAGVTRGCNPAEGNTKFCPDDYVTRGQLAAFLHRILE